MPKHELEPGRVVLDQTCGCRGCASGPGGYKNIYGNKYGQNLADIQVRREKTKAKEEGREWPMVAEEPRKKGDMPVYESVYEDTFSYPTVWESEEEENEDGDGEEPENQSTEQGENDKQATSEHASASADHSTEMQSALEPAGGEEESGKKRPIDSEQEENEEIEKRRKIET